MNETATMLSEGMLTWGRYERVGDRYGLIVIQTGGADRFLGLSAAQRYMSGSQPEDEYASFDDAPIGMVGTLVAEVVATRESGHIGDMFHGLYPTTPDVGERIVLGHGVLFTEQAWSDDGGVTGIGVQPLDVEREWGHLHGGPNTFWLDPRALYRAHEQTVRLLFEPDEAEA